MASSFPECEPTRRRSWLICLTRFWQESVQEKLLLLLLHPVSISLGEWTAPWRQCMIGTAHFLVSISATCSVFHISASWFNPEKCRRLKKTALQQNLKGVPFLFCLLFHWCRKKQQRCQTVIKHQAGCSPANAKKNVPSFLQAVAIPSTFSQSHAQALDPTSTPARCIFGLNIKRHGGAT